MAYTLDATTGTVTRNSDQQQVAPCQSPSDPDYVAYANWVAAGNSPTVISSTPIVFGEITRAQLRLALEAAGLTAAVEAAIAAGPANLRIMWEDSQTFHRNHPMVLGVQQAVGKTVEELDAVWVAAMGMQL
jgi:hypothetical protein